MGKTKGAAQTKTTLRGHTFLPGNTEYYHIKTQVWRVFFIYTDNRMREVVLSKYNASINKLHHTGGILDIMGLAAYFIKQHQ